VVNENPLTAPLVVKDLQGGVVGQTGTVWTIAPDGGFTVARQIGARVATPHKRGRLSGEQTERLRAMLERPAMAALPAQLGEAPHANARQITVASGAISVVLTLPAAGDPKTLRAQGPDHHSTQVLELIDLLGNIIGR
jgi:hypothetical protein